MSVDGRLAVVLCWHMHQPCYREPLNGEYILPWTYLHMLKDYTDMVAHLEEHPEARAVVNFTPLLLEQIDDYHRQTRQFLQNATPIRDPLLGALAGSNMPGNLDARRDLIQACLRAHEKRLIARFRPYAELVEFAHLVLHRDEGVAYVNNQFLVDLVVWYHLAWFGETVRRHNPILQSLQQKGAHFTIHDRRQLLGVIHECFAELLPRYRALADAGRIELSMTPWGHPILPLLLNLEAAHEALPKLSIGGCTQYPGGMDRARWHLAEGLSVFERHFGRRPIGCWPAEGGISNATLNLLHEYGLRWCASGETVLRNSLQHYTQSQEGNWLHRGYNYATMPLACFFRDDRLSDRIGFVYSTWHADDAVGDLIYHLENIATTIERNSTPNAIVSIIMDGENAWEYYPENGYYFLSGLYQRLADHPRLKLTTYAEYLTQHPNLPNLSGIVAGSWVYGTFSTWIGSRDKNRGWEMLIEAKRAFDQTLAEGRIDPKQLPAVIRLLGICESSDWFWWFGDDNPEEAVSNFEHLFRRQLTGLYRMLGITPPKYLTEIFTRGSGAPQLGGVMRPGQNI